MPEPKMEPNRFAPPSLRERKPKVEPKVEPKVVEPKHEPKQKSKAGAAVAGAPAGKKAKYLHTPQFLAKQASQQATKEAAKAARQMKDLSSGINAPHFDITTDVAILPSAKGERACVPCTARSPSLTCPPLAPRLADKMDVKVSALQRHLVKLELEVKTSHSSNENLQKEMALQRETMLREKELAITAEVGKALSAQAEARAQAFREGMAYAKEMFKEMRAIA